MPRLVIAYDRNERLQMIPPEIAEQLGVRQAVLDISEMDGRDVYEVARKLAEMLLEQLST